MLKQLVMDTTVLVALVDDQDKFHTAAVALSIAFMAKGIEEIYLDCTLIETVGVLCRRTEERKRTEKISSLLDLFEQRFPKENITWLNGETQRLFGEVLKFVRQSQGQLNFNDALIALVCKELNITAIASFDQDFDQVAWLKRIAKPEDLDSA